MPMPTTIFKLKFPRDTGAVAKAFARIIRDHGYKLIDPNRELVAALKAHIDAMDDLRHTLEYMREDLRAVQTYGIRINK